MKKLLLLFALVVVLWVFLGGSVASGDPTPTTGEVHCAALGCPGNPPAPDGYPTTTTSTTVVAGPPVRFTG